MKRKVSGNKDRKTSFQSQDYSMSSNHKNNCISLYLMTIAGNKGLGVNNWHPGLLSLKRFSSFTSGALCNGYWKLHNCGIYLYLHSVTYIISLVTFGVIWNYEWNLTHHKWGHHTSVLQILLLLVPFVQQKYCFLLCFT